MSAMNGQAWTNAEPFEPMDATHDNDFNNLLDFDNLDLDFNLGYANGGPQNDGQQLADLAGPLEGHQMQNHFAPQIPQHHRDGVSAHQQQPGLVSHGGMQQPGNGFTFDYGMVPYTQAGTPTFSQAQEQVFRPHQRVPPTPNSVEMHGDPRQYMHQMDQQAMFDPRFHMRKDDATFTPLVSPAVTPHDARFQIPDFTVPGAYFSPLTSPALNAQNQHHNHHHHSQVTTSCSSTGHSPIDVDVDMLGEPAMIQQDGGRKLRSTNKKTTPRSANSNNRVRQSPIVKPGRRKPTVSMSIPPKEVTELMQEARGGRPSSSGLDVPHSRETSETDSISPEPMLSEMRPPPKPGSVTHSPAMMAQQNGGCATPATPASLMRIQASPNYDGSTGVPPLMEDLTLPEASLDRPALSRLETAIHDAELSRVSSRKTPKLNPLSTPGGALSGRPSPMMDGMSTPTSPAFSMTNGKKVDSKLARNPKKRNSVSSNLVSPALRPKISPSIKPLLPENGGNTVTGDTHALLLASKSNYQNILDGTTVPGVVYPTSLSTNLTSKRTSHKIAEQGRRNRINMALQEMQALLPSTQTAITEAKSPETAAQSNNSKAAKVESAIEYIKQLKDQVSEKEKMLEAKDLEMEQLRKELAALRRSSSVSSSVEVTAQLKAEPTSSPNTNDGT